MKLVNIFNKTFFIISLLLIFVIPQLNYIHYDPISTFYGEFIAVFGTVILLMSTLFSFSKISIPEIIFFLLFFIVYLFIQSFYIDSVYSSTTYIVIIECLVLIFALIGISTFRQIISLEEMLVYLTIIITIGAIIQSIIGFIQFCGLHKYFNNIIFYDSSRPNTNIFGHFGQRNHYSHYLSWGIFSIFYLFHKNKINILKFLSLVFWLLFSITIASSRSVFIYFAVATLIFTIFYFKNKTSENKKIAIIMLSIFLGLIIFEFSFPYIQYFIIHKYHGTTGWQRLNYDNSAARRLVEWEKAWATFKLSPIIGFGAGSFPRFSVNLSQFFKNVPNSGLFVNSHNIIMQLLAETGLIGTLIIVATIITYSYRIFKLNNFSAMIIMCMICTTLIHSFLEYPLWYLYFLIPFVIFIGSAYEETIKISRKVIIFLTVIPLAFLIYFMSNSIINYNKLTHISEIPSDYKQYSDNVDYLNHLYNKDILWKYIALGMLDDYITIDDENTNKKFTLEKQLEIEEIYNDYRPYPSSLIKLAMLYYLKNDKVTAYKIIHLAMYAYPNYKNMFLKMLKNSKYIELKIRINNFNRHNPL